MADIKSMMVSKLCYATHILPLDYHILHSYIMSEQQQDQSLNVRSPYYFHPGENPGIALVSPVLDSSNYNSWS